MSGLTNEIEQFLLEMIRRSSNGVLEIGRNELADRFSCAPSQINYVLSTRFTPYKGYYIESRRGGSGYIRITRLQTDGNDMVNEVLDSVVKDEVTADKAKAILKALEERDALTETQRALMHHAIDDNALRDIVPAGRNRVRASILKNMLLVFLK